MDAGVVAVAIPDGQVVGLALGVTGAALWGDSKATQWFNKATDGAIGRRMLEERRQYSESCN